MKNFNNKVAAITGAGSGIGQQLAVLLAKQGCHLALSDINEQGLAQTVELLQGTDVRVTIQKVNVAELEQVRNWAAQVEQDHGSVNMILTMLVSRWVQPLKGHLMKNWNGLSESISGAWCMAPKNFCH